MIAIIAPDLHLRILGTVSVVGKMSVFGMGGRGTCGPQT
jgi:hypothetical protein